MNANKVQNEYEKYENSKFWQWVCPSCKYASKDKFAYSDQIHHRLMEKLSGSANSFYKKSLGWVK